MKVWVMVPDRCCTDYFITPLQNSSVEATIVYSIEVWSGVEKEKKNGKLITFRQMVQHMFHKEYNIDGQ